MLKHKSLNYSMSCPLDCRWLVSASGSPAPFSAGLAKPWRLSAWSARHSTHLFFQWNKCISLMSEVHFFLLDFFLEWTYYLHYTTKWYRIVHKYPIWDAPSVWLDQFLKNDHWRLFSISVLSIITYRTMGNITTLLSFSSGVSEWNPIQEHFLFRCFSHIQINC